MSRSGHRWKGNAVTNVREYFERFIHDVTIRRRGLLLFLFCLTFSAEVWVLRIDVPQHKQLMLHVAVWAAVILLPFTMVAIGARFPFGRRLVKRRFVIRPFKTLASNSAYDGSAIASLMYRAIVSLRSSSKGGIEGQRDSHSMPTTTVVLGGASLPLDWLWAQIRHLLTGKRDITIEGLLIDSEPTRQLRVWTTDSYDTWAEDLTQDPFPIALDEAISKLAPQLLESLDPVLLARIKWYR
jgi:hypothetical protein